jgi:MFS family permease
VVERAGLILTSLDIGAIVGSVIEERVERVLGRSRTLFMCVIGIVITVSLRQRISPDEMLGRVNAGYRLFAWGTMPIGALLGGFIAELCGFDAVFWLAGIATLSLLAFWPMLTNARIEAAETAGREAREASQPAEVVAKATGADGLPGVHVGPSWQQHHEESFSQVRCRPRRRLPSP